MFSKGFSLKVGYRVNPLSCNKFEELTLSQTSNFRLFQTERLGNDNFKFDEKGRKFSKWVENTVGKRRSCSLQAISPFPTVFSKDLNCRHVKARACLEKGEKDL